MNTDTQKQDGGAVASKRCARELEMVTEARTEFVDALLAELKARGVDTDEWDSDDAPEIAIAHRMAEWMTRSANNAAIIAANAEAINANANRCIKELEEDKCGLAADALNARQLLREFMAYVKCGQVPEDAHCARQAKRLLASDLLDARAREGGGGGGSENLPAAPEKYNIVLSNPNP